MVISETTAGTIDNSDYSGCTIISDFYFFFYKIIFFVRVVPSVLRMRMMLIPF